MCLIRKLLLRGAFRVTTSQGFVAEERALMQNLKSNNFDLLNHLRNIQLIRGSERVRPLKKSLDIRLSLYPWTDIGFCQTSSLQPCATFNFNSRRYPAHLFSIYFSITYSLISSNLTSIRHFNIFLSVELHLLGSWLLPNRLRVFARIYHFSFQTNPNKRHVKRSLKGS